MCDATPDELLHKHKSVIVGWISASPMTVIREAAAEAAGLFEDALAEIQTREKVG